MASLEFNPAPLPLPSTSTFRRSSIELPRSILKRGSALRKLSLTTASTPLTTIQPPKSSPKKTVSFSQSTSTQATKPSHSLAYHLQTAYAFTSKDTKTILLPSTIFAITTSLASSPRQTTITSTTLLTRLPLILLWTYSSLLPFCISNQNTPASIAEDTLNRPSRPLPSKRISPLSARNWMLNSYLFAILLSLFLGSGSLIATVTLIALGYLYNQCHGSENMLARNVLTGLGYSAFGVGALDVATGGRGLDAKLWCWVAILAGVVMTTGHMTDLPDLEGDRARGRRTIPVVFGAETARYMLAVPVLGASLLCPWYWDARFSGFLVALGVGGRIVERLVKGEGDKGTYKLWCGWVAVLYFVPLFAETV